MHVAPTFQQSYAYADLFVRFYAQLPDQYMYVLVTPVETIVNHPLNTVQSQEKYFFIKYVRDQNACYVVFPWSKESLMWSATIKTNTLVPTILS